LLTALGILNQPFFLIILTATAAAQATVPAAVLPCEPIHSRQFWRVKTPEGHA
jgi:hypothetical protein